jgi:predicted dehydrogenase
VSPPIRVALLGYGLAGAVFHAPLIASVEGLELAAIVTHDEERRARARRDHPNAALLGSPEEVCERVGDLDLVVVAAANRAHVPLARSSIEAGLAVVVDKPLAASAGEGRSLVRDARERGVMLTVFQNRRWDGDFLTVRGLLEEGALGEIARFESRFERWRPELSGGWRESGDPQDAGGLLNDLGSHLVDQALFLFGPAAKVYSELDTRRAGAQTDDDSFVALLHESGVRSHLWMSAVAARPGRAAARRPSPGRSALGPRARGPLGIARRGRRAPAHSDRARGLPAVLRKRDARAARGRTAASRPRRRRGRSRGARRRKEVRARAPRRRVTLRSPRVSARPTSSDGE